MPPEIEWDGHIEGEDDPNAHAERVRLSRGEAIPPNPRTHPIIRGTFLKRS